MATDPEHGYDAVLLVAFGGPEGPDDVMPFLRTVTDGRDVPERRLRQVAARYQHFGGVSPINDQCRRVRAALEAQLAALGHRLDVYWGNRNWHPRLSDTVAAMAGSGVRRALAVVMSAYSSYPGCRRYLEDIDSARRFVGPAAPRIDKVRAYHDHPGFVEPLADAVRSARRRVPAASRDRTRLVCTAHSIPVAMAETCDYELQLRETAELVAGRSGFDRWDLVWQSRSGPPTVPWLEPDVNAHLGGLAGSTDAVVIAPVGFVSDHMEVVWDLDVEAAATAAEVGLHLERAETPGTAPDARFVSMLAELVIERLDPARPRRTLGVAGPRPDRCPEDCCPGTG